MRKINEKEYVEKFLQDLKVKARDINDFHTERKYKRIISKFEKGIKEEYNIKKEEQEKIA